MRPPATAAGPGRRRSPACTRRRRLAGRGLGDLRFNDGVVIQHVLAASKAVADLERQGLLSREPDPADARTKLLHLTEHARTAVEATRALREEPQEELETESGAERVADARALLAAVIGRFGGDDAIRARRVRPAR